jgi:hypothetical protein
MVFSSERMVARGKDTTMRTLFLTTAALAALMIGAPVGKARAEYVHGFVNGQPFHANVYGGGPSGFGAGFAQGLANVQELANAQRATSEGPAIVGHRYWMSFDGERHDCSYDPPNPLAVAFGAKCRVAN